MSSVPRRAVLAAPLAALAGNLPSPAATAADSTSPTLLEVRRLVPLVQAAIAREIALEGQPGYAEACAQAAALDDEIEALAVSVWATPARSWADVLTRAELCGRWAYRDDAGRLEDLSSEDWGNRSMAELLEAVMKMAGHPNV